MKTKRNSSNGGIFESLGRYCARHAWQVVAFWVVIFVIGAVLYLTMFSRNMTTVIRFTTATDSQLADDLFVERFPQAGYDQESHLISSNRYTADDPEFFAYVDGLYKKLAPLREQGIVKDVQYYEPLLREGVPQAPALLEKMIAAMKLISEGNPTPEQLYQASDDLKASAAHLTGEANRLSADIMTTGAGKPAYNGLIQATDGAEELSVTCLAADAARKTYDALLPMTQGAVLTAEEREARVAEFKATAARLTAALAYLEATGPGTADRPTLVSGLKQFAEQAPLLAAMHELKYAAQLGVSMTDLFLGGGLPSVADVEAAMADMQTTGARLAAITAYVEQNVPDSPTRQTMLDGLNQASSQMNTYGTTLMPVLAQVLSFVEDPGSGVLGDAAAAILRTGLTLARGYMEQMKAKSEDGQKQLQEQTSAQIGQAREGIETLKSGLSQQLPTAEDGLAQMEAGLVLSAGLVSTDRHSTQFIVMMSEHKDEAAKHIYTLRDYMLTGDGKGIGPESFNEDGWRVRVYGNGNFNQDNQDKALSDLVRSLAIAVPISLVVLFIVFGTLGAALLPLVLSGMVIVVALGVCAIVGTWIQIAFAIQNIVALLGLSLGIDHALFIAYRYREERRKGRDKLAAIGRANGTAGHAIFWAGVVVIISFMGIMFIPCSMHCSLGVGAFTVLFVIIPASLTLLPAMLSLLGNGFDFGRLPWQKRLTDPLPPEEEGKKDIWHWITRPAMRVPIISFVLGAAMLALVIWPYTKMKLSYTYVEALPSDCIAKSGLEALLDAGYPVSQFAPVMLAIDGYDKPEIKARTEALLAEMEASGKFLTFVPIAVNTDGTVAQKICLLNIDPFTAEASETVRDLRRDFIGDSFKDAGGACYTWGPAATQLDFMKINEDYMDPILTFVLVLRLLLLMFAFHSILIALFLTVLSVLSLYAGYGLVVWVFQDGHTLGIYQQISGIDVYVPFMLMCGLLGISMDFLVFMTSRVRERYDQNGGDPNEAIMHAFRRTGFVVMGTAAVMAVIFFAFSISKILTVAEIGFGMTVAMFVDATLVNFLMSPAVMRLLGKWVWWWPSWFSWLPDWRAHPGSDEVPPEENVFGPSYRPAETPGYGVGSS